MNVKRWWVVLKEDLGVQFSQFSGAPCAQQEVWQDCSLSSWGQAAWHSMPWATKPVLMRQLHNQKQNIDVEEYDTSNVQWQLLVSLALPDLLADQCTSRLLVPQYTQQSIAESF